MIRLVLAPADPADIDRFADVPHTDGYVKVIFPSPGVEYPEPFDMTTAREAVGREHWPALRTYTLRAVDRAAGELTVDFVHHGDTGLAGPWAAAAAPGDEVYVNGPGGAYSPDPEADWHLLAGDEAALPAIAASLAQVPAGVPVHAFVEVADASEEQPLDSPGQLHLHWLHRDTGQAADGGSVLAGAVRGLEFPAGRVHAFVHGEAGAVKELRRHLLDDRGLSLDQLSISGYWRRGLVDEDFREYKREQARAEADADARAGRVPQSA
jgi:NADPH-dependent ferric siderophore reductase